MARGDLIFIFRLLLVGASASATVSSTPPSLSTDHHHHHLTLPDRCDASLALLHHIDFLSHPKSSSKHGNLRHLQIESVSALMLYVSDTHERDTHDKWQDILLISGSSHVSSSLCVFKIDSTRRQVSPTLKKANTDRDTLPSVNTAVCRECWCAHNRARREKKIENVNTNTVWSGRQVSNKTDEVKKKKGN